MGERSALKTRPKMAAGNASDPSSQAEASAVLRVASLRQFHPNEGDAT